MDEFNKTIDNTVSDEVTRDRINMTPVIMNDNRPSFYKSLFPERKTSETKTLVIPPTLDNWHKKIDIDKMLHWLLRKFWIPVVFLLLFAVITYFTIARLHTFPTTYTASVMLLYQKPEHQNKGHMSINTVKEMIMMQRNCQGVKTLLNLDMSIEDMQDMSDVIVSRNSNIIELVIGADTPKMATEIANTLAEVALNNNRNFYESKARSLVDNFTNQVDKARKTANPVQDEFILFKQKNNILDIDLAKKQLIDTMSNDITSDMTLKRQLVEQESEISFKKELLAKLPPQVHPGNKNNMLKQELSAMQVRYVHMSEEYGERNPKLIQLKGSINRIRAKIDGVTEENDIATLIDNPKVKQLGAQIREQEAAIKTTREKLTNLEIKIKKEKEDLALFPNLQQQYGRLLNKKQSLEETVENLEVSAQNATIDFVRPRTDFEIYQLASNTVENPSYTRIILSTSTGSIISLFSLSWLIISYFVKLKLSTEKEIDKNYTPPCLAVIPKFTDEDMYDISSPFQNHIEALAEKIALHTTSDSTVSIALCSAYSSSSKSVIAYELSRFYARLGLRTVFLDFDNGPDGVFEQTHDIEDIINHQDITDRILEEQGTFEKLKLNQHGSMHDCIKSLACNSFLERIKAKNDVIIIDAPGILEGLHSCDIINMADYQIFSVHSGLHKKKTIDDALIKLQELRIYPIGMILNSTERHK